MSKYISGPWRVSGVGQKGSKRVIFKSTDTTSYPIATVQLDTLDRLGTGDTDATAHLISAAPDMFRLLESIQAHIIEGEPFSRELLGSELYRVIAKAKGEK